MQKFGDALLRLVTCKRGFQFWQTDSADAGLCHSSDLWLLSKTGLLTRWPIRLGFDLAGRLACPQTPGARCIPHGGPQGF